jgi:uncharacterized membrane protein YkvA (DUF1232 family)
VDERRNTGSPQGLSLEEPELSAGWWDLLLAGLALVGLYLMLLALLVALNRRSQARALARFLPDCTLLFQRLVRDPRLPRRDKLLVGSLVGYLALPLDLVPDFIPVLGQLDDACLVVLVLRRLLRRAGRELLAEHWPGPPETFALLTRLAGAR